MLECKFRAKSDLSKSEMDLLSIPHNNDWIYGNLVGDWMLGDIIEGGEDYIQPEWWVSIQEGTKSQFTGLLDVEGVEIYSGDIVRLVNMELGEIKFLSEMASFVVKISNEKGVQYNYIDSEVCRRFFKVVGNKWDNPNMLNK